MEEFDDAVEGDRPTVPNPFQLFPIETWEEILGKCEDSQDILRVLKAYPMMEGVVLKNRCVWLLDQVLPHIRSWIKNDDLLSCRQVCLRWFKAVDNYVENHPIRRPIDWEHPVTGQLWIPEASPEYWTHFLWDVEDCPLELGYRLGDFHKKMQSHPPGRNPFIGRSIEFDLDFDDEIENEEEPESWNGASEVLQRFGSQIWFILAFANSPHKLQFYERLLPSLDLLPNLKSLDLDIYSMTNDPEPEEVTKYLETKRELLPPLPQLETIRLCPEMPTLGVILIQRYSTQIRRLAIPYRSWRKEYSNLFPKLTELTVWNLGSHEEVTDLLLSLEAPDLYSLDLNLFFSYGNLNPIVSLLKRFKRIQNFRLRPLVWSDGEVHNDALSISNSVPSLKSLLIQGVLPEEVDFGHCFPSLEYMLMYSSGPPPHCFGTTELHQSGLWEILPRLKEITLIFREFAGRGNILHLRCSRVKYDWVKKNGNGQSSVVQEEGLARQDEPEGGASTTANVGLPTSQSMCSIL